MMLSYERAKSATEEQFKALTSLTKAEFEELLIIFSEVWRETDKGRGSPEKLSRCEDKLLFILFYLKNYPIQEVLGFLFGIDQSQANRWIMVLSKVLRTALERRGYMPARTASQLEELGNQLLQSDLIIDGVERPIQRPTEEETQKQYYSGKKKEHSVKNLVIVNEESRRIAYLSATGEGKKHDKKLADESEITLPKGTTLIKDKGFEGYEVEGASNYQPKKKPKGRELTALERSMNSAISSVRIVVEHVIAGLKRCRVVKDIFRNTKKEYDDLAMELACGLHNFRVTLRKAI